MPETIKNSEKTNRGYFFAFISALFLSTTPILIRYLTQTYQVPALVLAFWRAAFVFLTLTIIFLLFNPVLFRVKKNNIKYLIIFGLILAIFNAFWTLSVAVNGASIATVLVYSSTAFTALLGRWLLKEKLNWVKILAIFLSLGGCVLVSEAYLTTSWQLNFSGISTGILAGLLYAIYSLMGRTASNKGLNPWTTLIYTFGFGAFFLLLANLIPGNFLPGKAIQPNNLFWLGNAYIGWLILFLLAAIPTLAGYGLYNVSLSFLPSSITNLIATTEPVFTAVIAYLFLNERLSGLQISGSVIILTGVISLRLFDYFLKRQSGLAVGKPKLETQKLK
jgi:drug/metabolite transporter (DMT)-like permease